MSGYVNWPFDTSVCGQMAAVGRHSRMISDLDCGWACSSETSNLFGFSSLFIWSLYIILAGAHLLGILTDSVKCVVRHHGASKLRYFNVQWREHFCVSELKWQKSLSQTSIKTCLIWQHLKNCCIKWRNIIISWGASFQFSFSLRQHLRSKLACSAARRSRKYQESWTSVMILPLFASF